MNRPCLSCGTPTPRTRCPSCERTRDTTRRGTTTQRGYGSEHQAARRALAELLPTGCGYGCGVTLYEGSPWVAAHVRDGQPAYGLMISCPPCNERAKIRR